MKSRSKVSRINSLHSSSKKSKSSKNGLGKNWRQAKKKLTEAYNDEESTSVNDIRQNCTEFKKDEENDTNRVAMKDLFAANFTSKLTTNYYKDLIEYYKSIDDARESYLDDPVAEWNETRRLKELAELAEKISKEAAVTKDVDTVEAVATPKKDKPKTKK